MSKKDNTENTEIIATQKNEVAATPVVDMRGLEDVNLDSVIVPIAKLLQSNSPEVTDDSFSDYNFKAGFVIHSLLLEKLPDNFIPLKVYDDKVCFIPRNDADKEILKRKIHDKFGVELTPEEMNGMILCRSRDDVSGDRFGKCAQCGLSVFDGNEKPFCNANINVLAIPEGQEMPLVIRFSNTSHKHGRQLKSVIYYSGGPIFKKKYKLVSTKKSGNGNTWYELSARPAGPSSPDEYALAETLYSKFLHAEIDTEEQRDDSGEVKTEF